MEGFKFEQTPTEPEDNSSVEKLEKNNNDIIEEISEKDSAFFVSLREGLVGYSEEDKDRIIEQVGMMITEEQQSKISEDKLRKFFQKNLNTIKSGEKEIPTLIEELTELH